MTKLLLPLVLLCSCLTMPEGYIGFRYDVPSNNVLTDGPLKMTVTKFYTGINATNYLVCVKIVNSSPDAVTLDSADFEVLDSENGATYYSISKDRPEVKLKSSEADILTKNTIGAKQITYRKLYIVTADGAASSKKPLLIYKDKTIEFSEKREREKGDNGLPDDKLDLCPWSIVLRWLETKAVSKGDSILKQEQELNRERPFWANLDDPIFIDTQKLGLTRILGKF